VKRRPVFMAPRLPSAWPEADRRAWLAALEEDPLALGGAGEAAKWRPSTRRFAEIGYGVWLAWLDHKGRLVADMDPALRATHESLREFLADMRWAGLSDFSSATRLGGLAAALGAIAPSFDVRFISRAAGRVRARGKRVNDLEARFRPPEDLLALGHELMARGDNRELDPLERALLFRDGLLIALMVHRPLRISNMAAIEVDLHLRRTKGGFRLEFEATEMKSARPYACVFPQALNAALERYLAEFRPRLDVAGTASSALWLGCRGLPMKSGALVAALRRRTRLALGIELGPHILRHIVATALAERSPNKVSEVPTILGHQNLETSERHYVHANAIAAGHQLQEAFAARSDATRAGSSRRPPR
jgi:integrase/recombinase XerD